MTSMTASRDELIHLTEGLQVTEVVTLERAQTVSVTAV